MPQMTDTIAAKPRQDSGKGAAHKMRKAGQVPAVAYGPGVAHSFLSIDPKAFALQRSQFGGSHIYQVAVDGQKPFKALVRDVQIDPLSQGVIHVDFYALDMTKPIRIDVPIELEGKHAGAIDGGILQQVLRKVLIECLPAEIPQKLTADVTPLKIGESLHLSDIKLPQGLKLITHADEAICTVIVPAEEEVAAAPTAEGAAAEGAAAAGAEGAAAAPGKEGEKAAAGKEAGGKEGDKAEKADKKK